MQGCSRVDKAEVLANVDGSARVELQVQHLIFCDTL